MVIYYHCICCIRLFDTANGYIPNGIHVIYVTITCYNIDT